MSLKALQIAKVFIGKVIAVHKTGGEVLRGRWDWKKWGFSEDKVMPPSYILFTQDGGVYTLVNESAEEKR